MIVKMLFVYILFTLLSFLYIKKNLKNLKKTEAIAVLSGPNWRITKYRLDTAVKLEKLVGKCIPIAVCGKRLGKRMTNYLENKGVLNVILQNQSTNTYEDAIYLASLLQGQRDTNIVVVTSLMHQRRAIRTFKRVFTNVNSFTSWNELLSSFSPLIPLSWLICLNELRIIFKYEIGKLLNKGNR